MTAVFMLVPTTIRSKIYGVDAGHVVPEFVFFSL